MTDLSDLKCSRAQWHLSFQMALFFTDNRDAVLCGILILQLHLRYELLKRTKNLRLVGFNNHLDEFSHTGRSQPPRTSPQLSVFADCSLSDTCAHRAFLSLPAGPEGTTRMQRLSDINIFKHALPLLYFIWPKPNAAPECSTQHTKSPAAADLRQKLPPCQPRHANTTCVAAKRKAEEETKKSKRQQTKRRGRLCLHSRLPKK